MSSFDYSVAQGKFSGRDRLGNLEDTVSSMLNGSSQPTVKLTNGYTFKSTRLGSAFAAGVDDTDNLGWFLTTQFYTSTDNITLVAQGVPAGATIGTKVVRFGSKVYCDGKQGGFSRIYRADPPSVGGSPVTWSASLLTTAGTSLISTCFNKSSWTTGTNYLFFGEYGDPSGGPSLYRSPDGTTWTKVLGPISGLRHFHCVAADPYNPGHVYLTAGDGNSKVVYRSTDSGSTWTLLITDDNFQAVQISFSSKYVWFAGDSAQVTAWVMDRTTLTPIIAGTNYHGFLPVVGGIGARGPMDDGALTLGSKTLTSPSACFTADDVGRAVRFGGAVWQADYGNGLFITAVTNSGTATLSNNALGSGTALKFWLDGDNFNHYAFYGAVDPATDIYYATMVNEDVAQGNRSALLYLPSVGGKFELLEQLPYSLAGEVFFRNNTMWAHAIYQPMLTKAA